VNPIGEPFGSDVAGVNGDPSPDETASAGWQIVGVVRDAKYESLRSSIAPTIYVRASKGGSFELRTSRDPMALAPDVRDVVRQAGIDMPVVNMRTQTETIERQLFQERLVARLATLFGLVALLLAAVGLYGLLAHEVTRSTREIGIRVALGAATGQVLGRVVRQGFVLAAIGLAIGAAGSLAVTPAGQQAFRGKAGRSGYVDRGESAADFGGAGGLLHPRAPSQPRSSPCVVTPRITCRKQCRGGIGPHLGARSAVAGSVRT
jgi:hypothetical protein